MESIDEHLIPKTPLTDDPPADLAWWERRRLRYNIFLIGMIILMLWQFHPRYWRLSFDDTILWSVAYVLSANIFYSLGYLLPRLLKYVLKTDFGLSGMPTIIFNLGLIISLLTTSAVYAWGLLPFMF